LLQDDIAKFVSDPTPPPQLVDIPEEGKGKAKEHREVGKGGDTVTIEDTSDEEDGEMLQERFQLQSRFSRPGLPNIPLIEDPPASCATEEAAQCGSQTSHQEVEGDRDYVPRGELVE
jgi:hypothetical protein